MTNESQIEEQERIVKSKEIIESRLEAMKENLTMCDLSSMTNSAIRITDRARALKEQNKISSNDYMDIINTLDDIVKTSTIDCKCTKSNQLKLITVQKNKIDDKMDNNIDK